MKRIINGIIITLSVGLIGFVMIFSMIPNIMLDTLVTMGGFFIPTCIIFITMIIQIKRCSDKQEKDKIRKFWLKSLFVIYILLLILILFLNNEYRLYGFQNINVFSKEHFKMSNIIPFATIFRYIMRLICHDISVITVIINFVVNLILFAPMGFFIPLLFKEKFNNIRNFIKIILICSILVEVLQFITFRGASDIDDVILNTIGACITYYLMKTKVMKSVLIKILDI